MWGETRRRCEGLPFGKFLVRNKEQVSKFGFFAVFLRCTGLKISIFPRFPAIFRGPKKSSNADLSAVSWDFEGQACPKILRGLPAMNRFQNLYFSAVFCDFLGTQKFSKCGFFCSFTGFSRTGTPKTFRNLVFSAVFLWFWRNRPTKKNSEPANLSGFFLLGFWREGPIQKIESLDREPGNREVWKALTNCFSSRPLHPLETSAF